MPDYRFFMIRIFSYEDIIVDSVLIREYMGQRKRICWHILRSAPLQNAKNISGAVLLSVKS